MFNQTPAAVKRAKALLRAHCTAEQRANWEQNGWLWPVCGSAGGSFAFGTWTHASKVSPAWGLGQQPKTEMDKLFYQVWEYDPGTRDARFRWCVLPMNGYGELPEYDCIVGVKLLLEADEPAFRAIARQQWSRDGQPAVLEGAAQAVAAMQQQMVVEAHARFQQEMQQQYPGQCQQYGVQQQQQVQYIPNPAVQQGAFAAGLWQYR